MKILNIAGGIIGVIGIVSLLIAGGYGLYSVKASADLTTEKITTEENTAAEDTADEYITDNELGELSKDKYFGMLMKLLIIIVFLLSFLIGIQTVSTLLERLK